MPDDLLHALDAARADFHDALGNVDAELVTVPGVLDDWSVRDLVVHVAAWAEHAAAAIDLGRGGRGDEFDYSTSQTDAMNAAILDVARRTTPADALRREDAAFAGLRRRVEDLGAETLAARLGNGDTVEEVIRYDGPDHYAEHTAHLRAWFAADDDDDDE